MYYAFQHIDIARSLNLSIFMTMLFVSQSVFAGDDSLNLAAVPLFDGKRSELLNTWGGAWGIGNLKSIGLQKADALTGRRALSIELGSIKAAESRYLQCFASGFGKNNLYYQTRDLTRYKQIEFSIKNTTQVALHGFLQLKDYRDTGRHSATYKFEIPNGEDWSRFNIPLSLSNADWTVEGKPDLSRIFTVDFVFEPQAGMESGRLYLDNLVLIENGESIDIDAGPLQMLVERLAKRQWDGLWAARNRSFGIIPNNSYQVTDAGLNTTAAVLWLLPAAVRRHWVEQVEADRHVGMLLLTINKLQDQSKYLPPRYIDWVALKPSMVPEESSVDAAFLALALHQYKSLPATPPILRDAIDKTENRFDFAAFSGPKGWCMAYRYATPYSREGFLPCTYNGYTNESGLISLAAHLSQKNHVSIEKHWNTSTYRVRAHADEPKYSPIVHSMSEFRAPFVQALWNLFVDVRQRGADCYPDNNLAVNPWENFVCYEKTALNRLAASGRPCLVQPDAGDDGTLNCYQQFSVYENFGQGDLFMPWSSSFALLAGVDNAETVLRFLLHHGLHGALGMSDSAKWATGAPEPYAVTARQDFWNTSLSTMALLEWLDGPSRLSKSFAELPEVHGALDRVFPAAPEKNTRIIRPVIGQIAQ